MGNVETLNIKSILIILVSAVIITILGRKACSNENEVKQNGFYAVGIVTKKTGARGGRYLDYTYQVNNNKYATSCFVNAEYYHERNVGDTILIMVSRLKSDNSLVVENTSYDSNWGPQPKAGWQSPPWAK